jgi:hypothetical protein
MKTLRLAHPGIVAILEEDVDALVTEILPLTLPLYPMQLNDVFTRRPFN